jgi:hypothetical protein
MRCFFNLADAHQFILDEEGVEVTDVGALATHVAKAIEEFRLENGETRHWTGWRLEVADTSGFVLLALELDSLRAETFVSVPIGAFVLQACFELSQHLANMMPYALIFRTNL